MSNVPLKANMKLDYVTKNCSFNVLFVYLSVLWGLFVCLFFFSLSLLSKSDVGMSYDLDFQIYIFNGPCIVTKWAFGLDIKMTSM